jgi:3-deoxy-D-manno-octulosonate 8-phosphate phosphatase (KDO 8-P phosphatase)
MLTIRQAASHFKGRFYTEPEAIAGRLDRIKAFVFDWDGVFNGGEKHEDGSSPFNEVDAMGTNLLRFNHHLRNGKQAITAIITGENNKAALRFANREHFHAVYCSIKYKATALDHLCRAYGISDKEVAFVYDDVLDFSIASRCGLRIMVNRACNPLMIQWAESLNFIDYLTAADGANYALRESIEMLMGVSGRYEDTLSERAQFTERYQEYLTERNQTEPKFFTIKEGAITDL